MKHLYRCDPVVTALVCGNRVYHEVVRMTVGLQKKLFATYKLNVS